MAPNGEYGQLIPMAAIAERREREPGMVVDLHIHTNASDGSYSGHEVARLAASNGIDAIAIADHDSLEGIPDAEAGCATHGIRLVVGVELSAHHRGLPVEVLGYGFDVCDQELTSVIANAGGVSVLAHPGFSLRSLDQPTRWRMLLEMIDSGIDGMECYHPSHSSVETEELVRLCRDNDLLITSGSDFHGPGHVNGRLIGYASGRLSLGELLPL